MLRLTPGSGSRRSQQEAVSVLGVQQRLGRREVVDRLGRVLEHSRLVGTGELGPVELALTLRLVDLERVLDAGRLEVLEQDQVLGVELIERVEDLGLGHVGREGGGARLRSDGEEGEGRGSSSTGRCGVGHDLAGLDAKTTEVTLALDDEVQGLAVRRGDVVGVAGLE